MIPVTVVTQNATHDDLTAEDYRDIYTELRQQYSLRAFVEMIASGKSIAYWSKYERGETELGRVERNELRRGVGLPVLVPTVGDALADVDPDAEVVAIGDKPKNRVLLATRGESLTIYANGTVSASTGRVTPVTRDTRKRLRREMTEAQAKVWDSMTKEERNAALQLDQDLL